MVAFRQSVHVESKTKDRLHRKLVLVQFSVGCAVTHLELKLKLTFQSDLHGFISPSAYGSDVHIDVFKVYVWWLEVKLEAFMCEYLMIFL